MLKLVQLLLVSARWRPLGLRELGECGGNECEKIDYEQQDCKQMHDRNRAGAAGVSNCAAATAT